MCKSRDGAGLDRVLSKQEILVCSGPCPKGSPLKGFKQGAQFSSVAQWNLTLWGE